MDVSRAPRLALSAIGVLALIACGELVARIQGDRLCLESPGAVLEAEPRFGWRYVPGLRAWVRSCEAASDPAVDVDVTASGLLDLPRAYAKPSETARVLLLGGDLSSPLGVRHPLGLRPRTLARWLEARADARRGRPLEVVDAATPGFALDNQWLYLRAEGLRYAPDLVVVVVDPAHDVRALSPRLLAGDPGGAAVKPYLRLENDRNVVPADAPRAVPEPPAPEAATGLAARSQLYRTIAGVPSRPGRPVGRLPAEAHSTGATDLGAERERVRHLAGALLGAMQEAARAAGAGFVVALAPPPDGGDPEASEDARQLAAAAAERGIPLVDLTAALAPSTAGTSASGGAPPNTGAPASDAAPAHVGAQPEAPAPGSSAPRRWNADQHFLASGGLWGFLDGARLLPPGVVPARILEGGQVRDPSRFASSFLDALGRDRRSLLPTFLQVAALAACIVWIGASLPSRSRDAIVIALGIAAAAWLGSPRFALLIVAFTLALGAATELLPGRLAAVAIAALLAGFVLVPAIAPRALVGTAPTDALEFASFATNVALLRFASYAIDRLRERRAGVGAGPAAPVELLTGALFYPTFPNGPIQSPRELAAARPPGGVAPESWSALGRHLAASARVLIRALGAVALLYAAWVVLNDKLRLDVFATRGLAVSRARLWLWVAELYFMFYASFNAWSTAAIAFGRLAGASVPENFDRPWTAIDVADFWRRWHITLGVWLRRTIYLPLGGSRRQFARNVAAVFLVSALWHVWGAVKLIGPAFGPRAWSGLLLWGAMNAIGVIASHRWGRRPSHGIGRLARQVATFVFVALAWVPFFLPPGFGVRDCLAVFARLFFLR